MSVNSQEILNPARAYVHLNEVGALAPADAEVALDATWLNVGHTNPESLSFNSEPEFQEVPSHQSDYAIARIQTSDAATVSVDLLQWNGANLKAVYGGGTVTEVGTAGSGQFKFVPPALGGRTEKSAIVEIISGEKNYRWVFPRVMQIEGVSTEFQKGQEARLPLRLAILGDDAGEPWYLLSNDPALDPTPVVIP